MGAHARLTEAKLRRVISAARAADPAAVIEVTAEGTIRILPATALPDQRGGTEVDRWFEDDAR